MDTALVRGVPDSFIDALSGESGPALDADRARNQHGAYVALLELAGYAIEAVAADERHPTLDIPVTTVAVHEALHLKSIVLPLDDETVLTTPNSVDEQALKDLKILYEVESERHRCSALPLRDGRLMVTANAPVTADMLAKAGYSVVPIDVSELRAADGGFTCLSIVFREA